MNKKELEPVLDTGLTPAEAAHQIFVESPYHPLRRLKCRYAEGELTIAGRVPSYFLKQLAQNVVKQLDGVERIRNIIEVSELSPL